MAYLTTADAKAAFQRAQAGQPLRRSATAVLRESAHATSDGATFDVFLSHCLRDAEVVAGVKAYLEEHGMSVYVDWIVDQELDRQRVTPATADRLRTRMSQSTSLLFATSEHSPNSKWMPWELGYFDGLREGRVAVLPLVAAEGAGFSGQEYLGLYPTVEKLTSKRQRLEPYVTKGVNSGAYLTMEAFRRGETAFRPY